MLWDVLTIVLVVLALVVLVTLMPGRTASRGKRQWLAEWRRRRAEQRTRP